MFVRVFLFQLINLEVPKEWEELVSSQPISFLKGGGQEKENRGGTENFPGIEGMRVAWEKSCSSVKIPHHLVDWKKDFENGLLRKFSNLKIIGSKVPRLWNTSLLSLPKFDHLSWVGSSIRWASIHPPDLPVRLQGINHRLWQRLSG